MKAEIMIPNGACIMKHYPPLAQEIGYLKALVVLQLDYWLHGYDKTEKDELGVTWIKRSQREMSRDMAIPRSTLDPILKELVSEGIVLQKQAKKGGRTSTTLNHSALEKLASIEIKWLESGRDLADPRPLLADPRPQLEEEPELYKEAARSSQLLSQIAALESQNAALLERLKALEEAGKKPTRTEPELPANWGAVMAHAKLIFPKQSMAAQLKTAWGKYPHFWDRIKQAIEIAGQRGANQPGPFVLGILKQWQAEQEAEGDAPPSAGESPAPAPKYNSAATYKPPNSMEELRAIQARLKGGHDAND